MKVYYPAKVLRGDKSFSTRLFSYERNNLEVVLDGISIEVLADNTARYLSKYNENKDGFAFGYHLASQVQTIGQRGELAWIISFKDSEREAFENKLVDTWGSIENGRMKFWRTGQRE